ncbi:hypothetical protein NR352_15245 [Enterobacter soli]|uniref:hypothetical protein n=1 Tax=Enterobacter soli TaxID=885040 RepID=UPI0021473461|nr:hypothetical protein [Enterobacter soli]MCR1318332.1 hypothetical protein [Enterobacter soli]
MSILELTQKVKAAGQKRTHEQRVKLLKSAHVLNSKGQFDKRFFTTASESGLHSSAKA